TFSSLSCSLFCLLTALPPPSTLFPYTTLFRSSLHGGAALLPRVAAALEHAGPAHQRQHPRGIQSRCRIDDRNDPGAELARCSRRSEEHTSELQSLAYLVCRLLLEKKKSPGIPA